MGKFRKIEEAIVNVTPKWSNLKLNIRGAPLYVDPILKGDSRFSRKTGAKVGVINPDVATRLTKSLQVNSSTITTEKKLNWVTLGSILDVGYTEKMTVKDYNNEVVNLVETAKINHDSGSDVYLWAVPIVSVLDYPEGSTTIQVRTKHKMILEDVIAYKYREDTFVNVYEESTVKDLDRLNDTTHDYPMTYELHLEKPLNTALSADEVIYLRAYPAYFSPVLRIPKMHKSTKQVGPHLLDWLSGRIKLGKHVDEIVTVQTYDKFSEKISPKPFKIDKNYPIVNMPVSEDSLLFWNLTAGTLKYTPNNVIAICNEEGRFGLWQPIQPPMPIVNWKMPIRATHSTLFRVHFTPQSQHSVKEFEIAPLTSTNVSVMSDGYIDGIFLTCSATPGAEITFQEWIPIIAPQVDKVSFNIMSKTTKEAEWLSTSLIIKPYFYTLDYIVAQYDINELHDGGIIFR